MKIVKRYFKLRKLKYLITRMRLKLFSKYYRRKLHNKKFTIIGNDCTAAAIYRKLGLQYTTPTVGLYFKAADYIKLLENFERYINSPLTFSEVPTTYPIGILGGDIEVHFQHYRTKEEAAEKWNRRVKRIEHQNLFFLFVQRHQFKEEHLGQFEKLPFDNKIFFSNTKRTSECSVLLTDYEDQEIGNLFDTYKYEKNFDPVKWLNGEQKSQV